MTCYAHAHRGAGWAWRDMQMDVSHSWGFARPGIGYWVLARSIKNVRLDPDAVIDREWGESK